MIATLEKDVNFTFLHICLWLSRMSLLPWMWMARMSLEPGTQMFRVWLSRVSLVPWVWMSRMTLVPSKEGKMFVSLWKAKKSLLNHRRLPDSETDHRYCISKLGVSKPQPSTRCAPWHVSKRPAARSLHPAHREVYNPIEVRCGPPAKTFEHS